MKTYLEIVMMLLATLSALLAATPASSLDALRKSVAFQGSQLSPDGKQLAWVESVSGPEGRRRRPGDLFAGVIHPLGMPLELRWVVVHLAPVACAVSQGLVVEVLPLDVAAPAP